MKSNIFFLWTFLLVLNWGCDDFLEEKSQGEIRPSTVKDMEKLLEGEAYFTQTEGPVFNTVTEIFTDDRQCNLLNPPKNQLEQKLKDRYRFSWDPLMFEDGGGGEDLSLWQVPYSRIKGCNVILDYMDGMTGDEDQRFHVLGEAYTLRGFYYLYLVNFFGLPYNYGDPTKNAGVPLKLTSGVTDEKMKPASVAACYEQIERDLLQGVELMKKGKNKASNLKTRLNYLAGYAFLSRMYLYTENWDKVIAYADSVLQENANLTDLSLADKGVYNENCSQEMLWGGGCEWYDNAYQIKYPYTPSTDLVMVYKQDVDNAIVDIRGDYESKRSVTYLKWGEEKVFINSVLDHIDYFVSFVEKSNNTPFLNGGIRTAEVYLNRAEAYIRRYLKNGAEEDANKGLTDLNTLREARFEDGYVPKELADFATNEELLAFCLRERRRELCGEGNHRWFDLRRTGLPEIRHIYKDEDTGQDIEYVLQKEDSRYVLPIPGKVLERNPNLR